MTQLSPVNVTTDASGKWGWGGHMNNLTNHHGEGGGEGRVSPVLTNDDETQRIGFEEQHEIESSIYSGEKECYGRYF